MSDDYRPNRRLQRFLKTQATLEERRVIDAILKYRALEYVILSGGTPYAAMLDTPDCELKPFRGLLNSLHDAFWPGSSIYEHRAAARHLKRNARAKATKSGIMEPRRMPSKAKRPVKGPQLRKAGRWTGVVQGSHVHKQLEAFANTGVLKNKARAHAITRNVVTMVEKRKWIPVCGELGVRDVSKKIATWIDLVCWDPLAHELVLIEIKTGYKDCFCASSRTMSGSLCGLMANSPLNQALLQLMTGISFLLNSLGSQVKPKWAGYVIRADAHSRDIYAVNHRIYHRTISDVHRDLQRSQTAHYQRLKKERERKKALKQRKQRRRLTIGLAKRSVL